MPALALQSTSRRLENKKCLLIFLEENLVWLLKYMEQRCDKFQKSFAKSWDPLPQPWQLSFVQYTAVRPVQNSCEACPNLSHLWDVILSTMLVRYTVFWLDLATYKWNFPELGTRQHCRDKVKMFFRPQSCWILLFYFIRCGNST